jgi:hypothetical protein
MIKFQDVKRPPMIFIVRKSMTPAARSHPVKQSYGFEDEVSSWKRNIKISPMDYKAFKDEAT